MGMQASLAKMRELPDNTIVYSAHEYTQSNAKFALQVEPNNAALQQRVAHIEELRAAKQPTVPTIMSHEKATNPMLRWDAPEIQQAVGQTDALAVFTAVRKWKDTGKKPEAGAAGR